MTFHCQLNKILNPIRQKNKVQNTPTHFLYHHMCLSIYNYEIIINNLLQTITNKYQGKNKLMFYKWMIIIIKLLLFHNEKALSMVANIHK